MLEKQVMEKIKEIKKGTFVNMEYRSYPKPLAKHKDAIIEKKTKGVYRLGISYANLKVNKDKETGAMPWGQWDELNYIVENKGVKYLRVYMANTFKNITQWFLNGVETTKEYLIENGYISANSVNKQHTECFTIKLDNIISIGKAQ